MSIGPVEYVILGFPGNQFTGQIVPELAKLIDSGLVRIIDLTFIMKDAAGNVEVGQVPIVPAAWQSWTNFVQSVDYNMSVKDQIRGRFIYNKENLLDNAAQLGTFFAPYSITFALINASEYHTFTPNVTNEFRVGFNRRKTSSIGSCVGTPA